MECSLFESAAIDAYPSKQDWDAAAVEIVATMLDRWHLTPGEAFIGGEAAAVLRVTDRDGVPAVLKVGFPHPEGTWEAVALEIWSPRCAPRVLRQDAWTWSMLLSEVVPGVPLSRHAVRSAEALEIGAGLYAGLAAQPPAGMVTVAEIVELYLSAAHARLPGQEPELARLGVGELVHDGLEQVAQLAAADSASTLLHGDFNPGNILLGPEGWVAIDPKPMAGDREFDLAPLVSQLGSPMTTANPARTLSSQLQRVVSVLDCDLALAARWAFARAALTVTWLVADGHRDAAAAAARELQAWAELSEP